MFLINCLSFINEDKIIEPKTNILCIINYISLFSYVDEDFLFITSLL